MRKSWGKFLSMAGACLGLASPAPAWEVSLGRTLDISNQESFSYCSLYSMASFLELYAKATKPQSPSVAIDPGYLATAYNHEVGNGVAGAFTQDIIYLVQKYGAIPKASHYADSVTDDKLNWPLSDWRKAHEGLMPLDFTAKALGAEYTHPEVKGRFTGKSFLQDNVGVDFRDWSLVTSNYRETCKSRSTEEGPKELYRGESYGAVAKQLDKEREGLGFKKEAIDEAPGLITSLLTVHLYQKKPALLSIRTGFIKNFSSKRVVTTHDLAAENEGRCGTHIGVAVGHCHKKASPSSLCGPFQKELEASGASECIVFQNSWGKDSNEKGYACLTRNALERVLSTALILREFL